MPKVDFTGSFANQAAWSFQNAIKATKQGPAAGCRLTLRSFLQGGFPESYKQGCNSIHNIYMGYKWF